MGVVTDDVQPPRAVVFDWDGTLVNSQGAFVASWRHTLALGNYQTTNADERFLLGRAFPDILCYFGSRTDIEAGEFEATWRADFHKRVETEIYAYNDAILCADAIREAGIPLAIATQTPRVEFDRLVRITGLDRLARVTVCRDEVEYPKPAPDLFLAACKKLATAPSNCLAIEDSVVGVQAARSAGLEVAAIVRHPNDREQLSELADHVFEELTPHAILVILES